jgi:hypothetical protein
MIAKRIFLMTGAVLLSWSSIAMAQPMPPPGGDPYGYYSQYDREGYYDRQGRYRHIRPSGPDYGPPPPPPPAPGA